MPSIKRLIFDIETSPNVGLFWRPGWKVSLGAENIIKERGVICVAWKWEGDKEEQCINWTPKGQDDTRVIRKTAELLNSADEIVAHNGDKFDIPWIRGRCLRLGIPLNPRLKSQDTCALAKRLFNLNSNRLDYIASYLGFGHKLSTGGFQLWRDVLLNKDHEALGKMVRYCKRDVELLEKVWKRMVQYVPAKSHISGDISNCPECDSPNTVVNKHRITAAGHRQVTLKCKDCGKYHTIAASRFKRAKEARYR